MSWGAPGSHEQLSVMSTSSSGNPSSLSSGTGIQPGDPGHQFDDLAAARLVFNQSYNKRNYSNIFFFIVTCRAEVTLNVTLWPIQKMCTRFSPVREIRAAVHVELDFTPSWNGRPVSVFDEQ